MSKSSNQQVGAFLLNNDATYPWNVHVYTPSPTGGAKVKSKFKAEFKHVSPERRLEILQEFREQVRKREELQARGVQNDDDVEVLSNVLTFESMLLDEVLISFSGIVDKDRNELPCSADTKAALIANSWARDATLYAYNLSLQGRSAEGN